MARVPAVIFLLLAAVAAGCDRGGSEVLNATLTMKTPVLTPPTGSDTEVALVAHASGCSGARAEIPEIRTPVAIPLIGSRDADRLLHLPRP